MKILNIVAVLVGLVFVMAIGLQQLSSMILAPEYCKDYYGITWCSIPEKGK